jgi:hypothetical protein
MTKLELLQALRTGGELRQMRGSWWLFPRSGGYGKHVPATVVEDLQADGWITGGGDPELTEKGK